MSGTMQTCMTYCLDQFVKDCLKLKAQLCHDINWTENEKLCTLLTKIVVVVVAFVQVLYCVSTS